MYSVPDLSGLIRPGDCVVCGQVAAEPLTLTRALVAQRERLGDIEIFLGAVFSDTFSASQAGKFRFRSYGAMARASSLAAAGLLRIVPSHYSELERAFEQRQLRADVVLIQLAVSGRGGGLSFGLANDYVAVAASHARLVIAEINPDAPWTHGAEVPKHFRIDLAVEASFQPLEIPSGAPGVVETRVAEHIAAIVPDGATLQMGIGSLPDAVLAALSGHRDLGVHSGLIGDRTVELIESGVITNARKSIDPGITVTNTVGGSQRSWRQIDDNHKVRVLPAAYTHDAATLARLDHLFSINSVLEIDLSGQANAESLRGRAQGGVGGINDFVRGARRSHGGRSIIALASTARDGTISRIVPRIGDGTVTVTRSDIDLVVTEWGVADLRHCDLGQRAERLIAIAAPQFREPLTRALRDPRSWMERTI